MVVESSVISMILPAPVVPCYIYFIITIGLYMGVFVAFNILIDFFFYGVDEIIFKQDRDCKQTSCLAKPISQVNPIGCKINPLINSAPHTLAYSCWLLYSFLVGYDIFQQLRPLKNYFEECNWLL